MQWKNLTEVLAYRASETPDKIAYLHLKEFGTKEEKLTYKELQIQSKNIANYLQSTTDESDRVILMFDNSLDFIISYYGCLLSKRIAVPVHPPLTEESMGRLNLIIKNATPAVILTNTEVRKNLKKLDLLRFFSKIPILSRLIKLPKIVAKRIPINLNSLDPVCVDQLGTFEEGKKVTITGDDIAFIQYSSGSTTTPKGVIVTHNNIISNQEIIHECMQTELGSQGVGWLPISHDMGLIGNVIYPLYRGFTYIFFTPLEFITQPLFWLKMISKYRSRISGGPNFAYELCVKKISEKDKEELDLSCWEVAYNGAEPVLESTLDRFAQEFALCGFRKESFFPCYGLAEATLIVSATPVGKPNSISVSRRSLEKNHIILGDELEEADKKDLVSVGKPSNVTKVKIIDPITQNELEDNQIGEIVVQNGSVTQGYWGVKDNNHLFTEKDKYLRTGDLGVIFNEELFITGRLKDLIIINGKNFYPQDFEFISGKAHTLCRSGCTAAFSILKDTQEEIVLVQEVKTKDSNKLKEIEKSIRQAISKNFQMTLHDVVLVSESSIPKTTSGKLQRYLCKNRYLEGKFEVLNRGVGKSEKEQLPQEDFDSGFQKILKDLMHVETLDPKEHILALGANSLSVAQLCMKLKEEYGIDLQIKDILEAKNLGEIEQKIKSLRAGEVYKTEPSIVPRGNGSKEIVPLSYAQKRMWFLDRRYKDKSLYNVIGALEIHEKLDSAFLQLALKRLCQDHEILRTIFEEQEGASFQRILEKVEGYYDEKNTPIYELIENEQKRVFDLEKGPLFKVIYVSQGPQLSYLVFNIHHIITDGWSIVLLMEQLSKYYLAAAQNTLQSMPKPSLQYADYSVWQNQYQGGKDLLEQESFWVNYLKNTLEPPRLPSDIPHINKISHEGASYRFSIPENFRNKMKILEKNGITPFMILFGLYALLLHRYTGEEEITVGVPVANRLQPSTKDIQGLFVNTIALKTKFDGQKSLHGYLNSIRKLVVDGLNNQQYPFEMLVQKLKLDRTIAENPLFNSMFVFESYPETLNNFAGAVSKLLPVDSKTALFDLTMQVFDTKKMDAVLIYSTDIFNRETIERLAENYLNLLNNVFEGLESPVNDLKMMSTEAEGELLYSFNHTEFKKPVTKSVVDIFEEQVKKNGSKAAVTSGNQTLTYSELNALANNLAKKIVALGMEHEEIIGVYLDRSVEMVVAILAILKAGGAYLPLNPELPKDRVEFMISDSKLKIVLTTHKLRDQVPSQAIFLDCDIALLDSEEQNLGIPILPNHLMYLIYTSGSTGRPKGVLIEHRGIVRLACNTNYFDFSKVNNFSQVSNFSFDASVYEIWCALLNGANVVIIDNNTLFDPEKLQRTIIEKNIDTMFLTTTLFHKMFMENNHTFDGLKTMLVGGEALNPHIVSLMLEGRSNNLEHLFNVYGPTENSVLTTAYELPLDLKTLETIPIGKPITNTTTYILDKNLNPVPIGVYGRLFTGGEGIARGYLNGNEVQNKKFITNPFGKMHGDRLYETGDICRYLPDGNIEYLRRLDNQVKVNGYRIELQEIESVIHEENNVRHAAVIVREDSPSIKHIVAYVVFTKEEHIEDSAADLMNKIKQKLPTYMLPHFVVELNELPINVNGKLDTKKLPTPQITQNEQSDPTQISETENQLINVFSQVLKLDPSKIGSQDHFFDLGGDSIMSMQIAYRMRKQGYELSVKDIFENPRINELAHFLDTVRSDEAVIIEDSALVDEEWISAKEYPVSSMQDFMLSIQKKYPDTMSYYPKIGFEIVDEAMDIEKLRLSFNFVMKEHFNLKTHFISRNGQFFQTLSEDNLPTVQLINYENNSEHELADLIQELIISDLNIPFEDNNGPLIRIYLAKLSSNKYYLLISTHHAITDGWSIVDLLREVLCHYRDIPAIEKSKNDPYMDLVMLEKKSIVEPSKQFWKQQCNEVLKSKPLMGSYSGSFRTTEFNIDTETLAKLNHFSSALHIPLKTVLLSAYYDALAQFYHQNHVTVSIVTSMRSERLPQTMDAHGLFWKFLPLPFHLRENKAEQLVELQKSSNEVLDHLFYPLNNLYTPDQLEEIFYASFNFTNFSHMETLGITSHLKMLSDVFSSPIQLKITMQDSEAKVALTMNSGSFTEEDLISFFDIYLHALNNYHYTTAKL